MPAALLPLSLGILLLAVSYAVGRQLARPSGWFGRRFMANVLNQGNKTLLEAAVDALAPSPGERIVDVGFGGGYALGLIRKRVAPARPVGVEISEAMVEEARRRWGDEVEVHLADVAAMPFVGASVDGLLSVNTLYFWQDPAAALGEIRRVLRPGGRVVLGIRGTTMLRLTPVTWFSFRLYPLRQVQELLRAAGFEVEVREKVKGQFAVLGRAL